MFALVDANNMYVSCERVFAPRLTGKPVVVLSSNDGACIARSNEAKELGVAMAQPWFQVRHLERSAGLIALSANFELYGDMSSRMMSVPERATNGEARAGDFVFAVGREPSGRVQASFGHVGAAGGEWRTWRGGRVEQLIRLDGGLYPGMAGAPVADASGRVLGVASPMLSRHHGVVLPGTTIDRVLAQLLTHGHALQGYLGIAAQPVRATIDGVATEGLLVSSVANDGPAAKAGLLVGDVIVEVGGQTVASIEALRARLAGEAVGSSLALKVARGGRAMQLSVEIAERPTRGGTHGHCCP